MPGRRLLVKVAADLCKNAAMSVPAVRSRRLARARAGVAEPTDAAIERYALQGLQLIDNHLGGVAGRSVVEFGPGDFLTSGLSMLAAGARRYAALDRFAGHYSSPVGRAWYEAIAKAWPRLYPGTAWPEWLDPSRFPDAYPDRVALIDGSVETASTRERFDIVCSFQVAEHVTSIDAFARANAELLAPGGVAIHRVDFGPHDWAGIADPYAFLRVPAPLWRAMGSQRGQPNRVRSDELVRALETAGLDVKTARVQLFPVEPTLDLLPKRLHASPSEALRIQAATFVCHRAESR
jgi:SAM-dependent methyltransferase